ncbi:MULTISPECIES: hypothetical protein [Haloferacaceae]|uniref:Uncharacterized protein n=1 Tax=Halorubrum glutamatedens TaxID=2707018 RepID=A0ABD5QRW4_9EURY|nr:hypothetical protein [Halobellus captivus]
MSRLLSLEPTEPLRYLLTNVVVWVGVASVVEFAVAGGRLADAIVTGAFGGVAFGVAMILFNGRAER